ncbi:MAG: AAA family ATPase [Planctomycetes bacterium]|nr:AAA family ATPase [Planctomycetota bacterium]
MAATPRSDAWLDEVEQLILARNPILYIVSPEEERVEERLKTVVGRRNRQLLCWSTTLGMYRAGAPPAERSTQSGDPLVALDSLHREPENSVFLFKDLHPFFRPEHPLAAAVVRRLRELAGTLRAQNKMIVVSAPTLVLPSEIDQDVTVLSLPLPGVAELARLFDRMIEEAKRSPAVNVIMDPTTKERMLHAALGLTLRGAEIAFSRALLAPGVLDDEGVSAVLTAKRQALQKSQLLESVEATTSEKEIAGLAQLKDWLRKRAAAFSVRAREFGLGVPRGVLLFGPQGCGKSLMARALSRLWDLPLLRLDIPRLQNLAGPADENLRRALALADTMAPCILFVDDVDKVFARSDDAVREGGSEAGRLLSTFIHWLTTKTQPVFAVFTAYDARRLPTEFLLRGVLDACFFLDLPSTPERKEALAIHLTRLSRDPSGFNLDLLADRTEGFTVHELELALLAAVEEAFYAGKQVDTEGVGRAIAALVPLSRSRSEDLSNMRTWAEENGKFATLFRPQAPKRSEAASQPAPSGPAPVPGENLSEAVGTFTKFDPRAKLVIRGSRREALRHAKTQVGWEHVLLSILKERQCLKEIQMLADFGLQGREVVRKLDAGIPPNQPAPPDPGGPMEPTDELRMALTWATTESARSGHAFMTPAHMLLGLLEVEAATRSVLVFPSQPTYAVQEAIRKVLKA